MFPFLEKTGDGRKDDAIHAIEMPSERPQLEPPAVLCKNTDVLDVRESLGLVPATARARRTLPQQRTPDGDPKR